MILGVKVKPNSLEDKVTRVGDFNYVIEVRDKTEDNKANKKVVNLLAKELRVSFRNIKIKNPKSREKIIEVTD
jgi:uncharacterized protein YggU (UPF0235/DUF167 family)